MTILILICFMVIKYCTKHVLPGEMKNEEKRWSYLTYSNK